MFGNTRNGFGGMVEIGDIEIQIDGEHTVGDRVQNGFKMGVGLFFHFHGLFPWTTMYCNIAMQCNKKMHYCNYLFAPFEM